MTLAGGVIKIWHKSMSEVNPFFFTSLIVHYLHTAMVPAVFYRALWIMASTIPSAQRKGNLLYSDVLISDITCVIKSAKIITPERYTRHSHPKSGLKDCTVTCFITGRISCPCCRDRMRTHIPTASPKHWQFPTFRRKFLSSMCKYFLHTDTSEDYVLLARSCPL